MTDLNPKTPTWSDMAIGLYDKLTERGAEITYEFDKFEVQVPRDGMDDTPKARWGMNGTVRVRTRDEA